MTKRAYYIEYPDKGFATIFKEDAEDSVIWTAEEPDADGHIAHLQQDGYQVIHFVSSAYARKGVGRTRRQWHRIDKNMEATQAVLRSFANYDETVERWEREDEEAYPDIEERRQRVLALVPEDSSQLAKDFEALDAHTRLVKANR
jgi:hypothetical protein